MLPQSVWADAVLSGTTLTITTTAAGQVSGYVDAVDFSSTPKSNVTKIVLDGYFNEADLVAIKGVGGDFTGVTEVDMANAEFVLADNEVPSQAFYYLYDNYSALPAGTTGDRAIVGGTLYKSKQGLEWISKSTPSEMTPTYLISSTSDFTNRSIGDYGKIQNGSDIYLKMHVVTAAHMDGPHLKTDQTDIDMPGNPDYDWVLNLILEDNTRDWDYKFGVYHYYSSDGSKWTKCAESDWTSASAENRIEHNTLGFLESDLSDLEASTCTKNASANSGKVMRLIVYYVKTEEEREWQTGSPTSEQMAAATSASFDYAYRENHKSEFSNGTWVLVKDYTYYQLQGTGSWTWQETAYTNGEVYYINKKYPSDTNMSSTSDGLPNADNQYAVKMGSNSGDGEYYRNGSGWKDPSQASDTPHYVDMKFSYWSTTLKKATTSKYADENINPEIFKDCVALEYVDFKAGVVKGFGDHTSPTYYKPFTIKIGKDVTKIENAAFRRCDVLTTVEWDTYTDAEKSSDVYPKELIIENEAFLQAKNLMSIKIPNRVTYIGDNAFEEVGTGTTYDVNSVDLTDNSPTFELIFERRHESDTDQGSVAINCDLPLTLGTKAFFNCWYLKELSLPIRLKEMGEDCFKNSLNLTTLTMREETNADYTGDKLRTIPSGAFEYSGVHEVTIPQSVTRIENKAFGSTTGLTRVTFQDNNESPVQNLFIESGAFSGGREEGRPQLDIYVMVDPSHRKMICEYAAFNYTQTVGQTSTLQNFAILHFPEDAWDYYQGNWKLGLAFRQDNLNSMKDGYAGAFGGDSSQGTCVGKGTAPINTSDGKYHTEGVDDKLIAPANGWQEFARTSTTIDIVIPNTGSFLRTYSTSTAKAIPLYAEDDSQQGVHAGDPFFKVYRISHFDDGWKEGDQVTGTPSTTPTATATEVKLHYDGQLHTDNYANAYIPAHTGLLMAGFGNGSVSYIVYMKNVTSGVSEPYSYTSTQNESVADDVSGDTNLLFPSCDDDGVGTITRQGTENGVPYVYLNPTYPYPYNTSTNPLQFRFFGLGSRTVGGNKEYYFGRFVAGGKVTRDKAYLRLTNAVFHWRDGSIGSQNVDPNASPAAVNPSRVALNFFDDEEGSETTGIKQVDNTMQRGDSNVFYTLEGVKLNSRPTQRGIYIHNGRKVVIK